MYPLGEAFEAVRPSRGLQAVTHAQVHELARLRARETPRHGCDQELPAVSS
jgi:hypothetical protein